MTEYSDKNRTTLAILGCLCLVLMFVVVLPWIVSPLNFFESGNNASLRKNGPAFPELPVFEKKSIEQFKAFTTRPLFIATRRLATKELAVDNNKLVLGRYAITGIIVSPNRRMVYLKIPPAGKTLTLSQGDKLKGWTVSEIKQDMIVLTDGEKEKRYRVRDDSQAPLTK